MTALAPYAGMIAVPAPVWVSKCLMLGKMQLGYVHKVDRRENSYNAFVSGRSMPFNETSLSAAKTKVEQQALARLGAVKIGAE